MGLMVFTSGDICLSSEKLLHWTIRKLFSLGNSPMLHSFLVRCGVSFVSSTNIVPLHLLCYMHALWSRRNRHHFADGIFNFFSNEIFCIKNTVSSRFVLYGWIDNNSTFVLKCLGPGQATSLCLNQWWPYHLMPHSALDVLRLFLLEWK